MFMFRPLPWDYGVRNLFRRPVRSLLTLAGLAIVVFLLVVVVAFVRGLQASLATSGDAEVVLVHSLGASENIENSSVDAQTPELIAASMMGVRERYGTKYVSPELYLATEVVVDGDPVPALGLVRGVTPSAVFVRGKFQLLEGNWPGPGEAIVGRLAATKLGRAVPSLATGRTFRCEGRDWKVSGRFAAGGASFESEIWCRVDDLQQAMKRQDLSLVAVKMTEAQSIGNVQEFCKERIDLELEATREADYYASLERHYGPVRTVAWLVVALIGSAGVFAGMNTMYGSVVGRVRELASLQTIGFVRRAIALSLVQEGTLLASAASLIGCLAALALVHGTTVRFTMGAFALRVDSVAILVGLASGVAVGILGTLPPALRVLRIPIVQGLKAV